MVVVLVVDRPSERKLLRKRDSTADRNPVSIQEASAAGQNDLPTLESVTESRRHAQELSAQQAAAAAAAANKAATSQHTVASETSPSSPSPFSDDQQQPQSVGELEQDAASQGAFNEETGEINWDCPCLGGMAHGPCGPEFREAFSCFVFSKEEPKGMDCIDKFKGMQTCFQAHPDIYGAELDDDDEQDR